jgi:hypothetical protein
MLAGSIPRARRSRPCSTPPKRSWRDGIRQDVASWNSHIKIASDVGAKLPAGIFNKETEAIRQQLAKSAELAPVRTILLNSSPSQMLLFSDDKKIAKPMEAADRHRPYAPKPTFNRSSGSKSRGGGKVTLTYAHVCKTTPYQKPKSIKSPEAKKSGNPKGRPLHKKRGSRSGRN